MSINPDSADSSPPGTVRTVRGLPGDNGAFDIPRDVHSAALIMVPCPRHGQLGVLFCLPSFFTSSSLCFASLLKELSSFAQDEVFAAHFLGTFAFK